MSELNFAKTFLQTLDARPTKYSPNHVFDPKTFPTRIPFTLPKLPQPPHPPYPKSSPRAPPAPGAIPTTPTISLTLKSARNPALTITFSEVDPSTTTVAQLRESVQSKLGGSTVVAAEKIKILYNKKPVPASKKTVGDVLGGEIVDKKTAVEMGIMILGGAPDPPSKASVTSGDDAAPAGAEEEAESFAAEDMEEVETISSPRPVQGPSGREILETEDFWADLQGFLEQRTKDESQAARLVQKWKGNWNTQSES